MVCDDCDQTFTSAVLFRIHKRAHENEHMYNLTIKDIADEDDRAEAKRKVLEENDEDDDTSGVKKLL